MVFLSVFIDISLFFDSKFRFITNINIIYSLKILKTALELYGTYAPTAAASPRIVVSEAARRNGKRRRVQDMTSIWSLFLNLGGVLKAGVG